MVLDVKVVIWAFGTAGTETIFCNAEFLFTFFENLGKFVDKNIFEVVFVARQTSLI